ncbi:MAG: hypothetical protein ACPGR2_09580 [Psychrobium sp.]
MLTTQQINELALTVLFSEVDIKNHHEVDEYIGLLLENISGCECLSDGEFKAVLQQIREIIETL